VSDPLGMIWAPLRTSYEALYETRWAHRRDRAHLQEHSKMAEQYTMTINGKPVKGSKTVGVINPATGKVFAQVPDCSKAELDQAFDAAQKAYPAWSRDIEVRRKVLQECAAALQANPEGLAKTLTMEQGKPLAKAAEELMGTAMWCSYTSSLQMPNEVISDT